jgi:hypothetical protein
MLVSSKIQERFWKKVKRTDDLKNCWLWQSWKKSGGYGMFGGSTGGRSYKVLAHRLSFCWERKLSLGEIEGWSILHACDNPSCVNPHHLFKGTQKDNIADMVAKGRKAVLRGEAISTALTCEKVRAIRKDIKAGMTHRAIAKKYGIGNGTVWSIKTGHSWGWLDATEAAS